MKSYSMRVEGVAAVLQLNYLPQPEPGPGQVLLRMLAAGLNRGEFIPGGLIKAGAAKPAGIEGAGEIVALGAGVTQLHLGQRVMGRCTGAFSEYAVMDVREAMPVPAGLGIEAAAAVPLSFLVVHDMLVTQGRLQAGEWLLITGVSSGAGAAALQAAKAMGAKVIGTSGSASMPRPAGTGIASRTSITAYSLKAPVQRPITRWPRCRRRRRWARRSSAPRGRPRNWNV
jgi:NADPH:quinone reductase